MQRGGMDDDRVKSEFERIETVAMLERQQMIIKMYHDGLARAWRLVVRDRYVLGRLDERLEVKDDR